MTKMSIYELAAEPVGFRLTADEIGGPRELEVISFSNLVAPFLGHSSTMEELRQNLETTLVSELEQQKSVTNGARPVNIEVLAVATLHREAIMKALLVLLENR